MEEPKVFTNSYKILPLFRAKEKKPPRDAEQTLTEGFLPGQ